MYDSIPQGAKDCWREEGLVFGRMTRALANHVQQTAQAGGFGDEGIAGADAAGVWGGGIQQCEEGIALLALGLEGLGGNGGGDLIGHGAGDEGGLDRGLLGW